MSSVIGVLIDVPGMTDEQYDAMASRLGWSGQHVVPPDGLVLHVAGPTTDGYRVIDVWRDEASFRAFSSTAVATAAEGLGLPPYEPEVFPVEHALGLIRVEGERSQ